MNKYLIVNKDMRQIEKNYLKSLGYILIYTNKNKNIYDEISSHVDIFCCKVGKNLILEPNFFNTLVSFSEYTDIQNLVSVIKGKTDVVTCNTAYNSCVTSKYAMLNFKNTDNMILKNISKINIAKINIKQKYSKCSILSLNSNSFVTCDQGIAKVLKNYSGIDLLYLESSDFDIKLLNNGKYSKMSGFIGGATCVISNKVILFGDAKNIKQRSRQKLIDFVYKKNLEFVDFKGLDIIDYGGIVEI